MHIEETGIVVVGAGIVGLGIAERLSQNYEVIVLERHESFGREASSRNSQVIHAGIYYPTGSKKARLCVAGSRMLYEFCATHDIAALRIGKVIPGIDTEEVERVHELFKLGTANGVEELHMLTADERKKLEAVTCNEACASPATGIVDVHAVMSRLEQLSTANQAVFAYGVTAVRFEYVAGRWLTVAHDADGQEIGIQSNLVVNAAGLSADKLAATAGIDIKKYDYEQIPCKGEYFRISEAKNRQVTELVYPAEGSAMDGSVARGVHLVQELDGSMKIGPNSLFGQSDLSIDAQHLPSFFDRMRKFLPWLEHDDLRVDSAGIRAMRIGEDRGIRDFLITEESSRGLPGLVNLIGMESPALTSSLAIAIEVESLIK